jgi:LacI family transcriptional regulator
MARRRRPPVINVYSVWSSSYAHQIALGAIRRIQALGGRPCVLRHEPSLSELAVDGVTGLFAPSTAKALLERGIPAVNVSQARIENLLLPSVLPDNRLAGRLAAEHLLERRYTTVLYLSNPLIYSELRAEGVREAVRAAAGRYIEAPSVEAEAALRSLPLPAGVTGANDTIVRNAMETAVRMKRHVPDHLAFVGITNDEIECLMAQRPLSSVDLNAEAIGDRAARLLMRLIAGQPAPPEPILIPPAGVVTRTSSDMLATSDSWVARVVRYARDHLADGLTVQDLARRFGMARQYLSQEFHARAGCTVVEMLQHLAVNRAKHLLAGSDLSIGQVASECGYNDLPYFGVMFRRLTGNTPAAYRAQSHFAALRGEGLARPAEQRRRPGPSNPC